ncbi:hypothetical protein BsWGS_26986 [Bradybaena similaris]
MNPSDERLDNKEAQGEAQLADILIPSSTGDDKPDLEEGSGSDSSASLISRQAMSPKVPELSGGSRGNIAQDTHAQNKQDDVTQTSNVASGIRSAASSSAQSRDFVKKTKASKRHETEKVGGTSAASRDNLKNPDSQESRPSVLKSSSSGSQERHKDDDIVDSQLGSARNSDNQVASAEHTLQESDTRVNLITDSKLASGVHSNAPMISQSRNSGELGRTSKQSVVEESGIERDYPPQDVSESRKMSNTSSSESGDSAQAAVTRGSSLPSDRGPRDVASDEISPQKTATRIQSHVLSTIGRVKHSKTSVIPRSRESPGSEGQEKDYTVRSKQSLSTKSSPSSASSESSEDKTEMMSREPSNAITTSQVTMSPSDDRLENKVAHDEAQSADTLSPSSRGDNKTDLEEDSSSDSHTTKSRASLISRQSMSPKVPELSGGSRGNIVQDTHAQNKQDDVTQTSNVASSILSAASSSASSESSEDETEMRSREPSNAITTSQVTMSPSDDRLENKVAQDEAQSADILSPSSRGDNKTDLEDDSRSDSSVSLISRQSMLPNVHEISGSLRGNIVQDTHEKNKQDDETQTSNVASGILFPAASSAGSESSKNETISGMSTTRESKESVASGEFPPKETESRLHGNEGSKKVRGTHSNASIGSQSNEGVVETRLPGNGSSMEHVDSGKETLGMVSGEKSLKVANNKISVSHMENLKSEDINEYTQTLQRESLANVGSHLSVSSTSLSPDTRSRDEQKINYTAEPAKAMPGTSSSGSAASDRKESEPESRPPSTTESRDLAVSGKQTPEEAETAAQTNVDSNIVSSLHSKTSFTSPTPDSPIRDEQERNYTGESTIKDDNDEITVSQIEDLQSKNVSENIHTSQKESLVNAGSNLPASAKSPDSRSRNEQERNYTRESIQPLSRKSSSARSERSEGAAEGKLSSKQSRDHAVSGKETPEEKVTIVQSNVDSNIVSGARSKASITSPSPKSPSRDEQKINYTGESRQSLSRKSSPRSAVSEKSEGVVETRLPSTRASMEQAVSGTETPLIAPDERSLKDDKDKITVSQIEDLQSKNVSEYTQTSQKESLVNVGSNLPASAKSLSPDSRSRDEQERNYTRESKESISRKSSSAERKRSEGFAETKPPSTRASRDHAVSGTGTPEETVARVQSNEDSNIASGIRSKASITSPSPKAPSHDEQEINYTRESIQPLSRKSSSARSERSEGAAEGKLSSKQSRDHSVSGKETPEEKVTIVQSNVDSNIVSGARSKASITSPSPKSPSRDEQKINYTGESRQSLSRKSSPRSAVSEKSEGVVETRLPSTRASMEQAVSGTETPLIAPDERSLKDDKDKITVSQIEDLQSKNVSEYTQTSQKQSLVNVGSNLPASAKSLSPDSRSRDEQERNYTRESKVSISRKSSSGERKRSEGFAETKPPSTRASRDHAVSGTGTPEETVARVQSNEDSNIASGIRSKASITSPSPKAPSHDEQEINYIRGESIQPLSRKSSSARSERSEGASEGKLSSKQSRDHSVSGKETPEEKVTRVQSNVDSNIVSGARSKASITSPSPKSPSRDEQKINYTGESRQSLSRKSSPRSAVSEKSEGVVETRLPSTRASMEQAVSGTETPLIAPDERSLKDDKDKITVSQIEDLQSKNLSEYTQTSQKESLVNVGSNLPASAKSLSPDSRSRDEQERNYTRESKESISRKSSSAERKRSEGFAETKPPSTRASRDHAVSGTGTPEETVARVQSNEDSNIASGIRSKASITSPSPKAPSHDEQEINYTGESRQSMSRKSSPRSAVSEKSEGVVETRLPSTRASMEQAVSGTETPLIAPDERSLKDDNDKITVSQIEDLQSKNVSEYTQTSQKESLVNVGSNLPASAKSLSPDSRSRDEQERNYTRESKESISRKSISAERKRSEGFAETKPPSTRASRDHAVSGTGTPEETVARVQSNEDSNIASGIRSKASITSPSPKAPSHDEQEINYTRESIQPLSRKSSSARSERSEGAAEGKLSSKQSRDHSVSGKETPEEKVTRVQSNEDSNIASGIRSKASITSPSPKAPSHDEQEINYTGESRQSMSRKSSPRSAVSEKSEGVVETRLPSTRASREQAVSGTETPLIAPDERSLKDDKDKITVSQIEDLQSKNVSEYTQTSQKESLVNVGSNLPASAKSLSPDSRSRDEQERNYTRESKESISRKSSSAERKRSEGFAETKPPSTRASRDHAVSGTGTPEETVARVQSNEDSNIASGIRSKASVTSPSPKALSHDEQEINYTRESIQPLSRKSSSARSERSEGAAEGKLSSKQSRDHSVSGKETPEEKVTRVQSNEDSNIVSGARSKASITSPSPKAPSHDEQEINYTGESRQSMSRKSSPRSAVSEMSGGVVETRLPSTRASMEQAVSGTETPLIAPDERSLKDDNEKNIVSQIEDLQSKNLSEYTKTSQKESLVNVGSNFPASPKSPDSRSRDEQERNYTRESKESISRKSSSAERKRSEGFAETKPPSTRASRDHAVSGTGTPEETVARVQSNADSNIVSGIRSKASITSPSPKAPSHDEQEINYNGESRQSMSRKSSPRSAVSEMSGGVVETRLPSTRTSMEKAVSGTETPLIASDERFLKDDNEKNIVSQIEDLQSKNLSEYTKTSQKESLVNVGSNFPASPKSPDSRSRDEQERNYTRESKESISRKSSSAERKRSEGFAETKPPSTRASRDHAVSGTGTPEETVARVQSNEDSNIASGIRSKASFISPSPKSPSRDEQAINYTEESRRSVSRKSSSRSAVSEKSERVVETKLLSTRASMEPVVSDKESPLIASDERSLKDDNDQITVSQMEDLQSKDLNEFTHISQKESLVNVGSNLPASAKSLSPDSRSRDEQERNYTRESKESISRKSSSAERKRSEGFAETKPPSTRASRDHAVSGTGTPEETVARVQSNADSNIVSGVHSKSSITSPSPESPSRDEKKINYTGESRQSMSRKRSPRSAVSKKSEGVVETRLPSTRASREHPNYLPDKLGGSTLPSRTPSGEYFEDNIYDQNGLSHKDDNQISMKPSPRVSGIQTPQDISELILPSTRTSIECIVDDTRDQASQLHIQDVHREMVMESTQTSPKHSPGIVRPVRIRGSMLLLRTQTGEYIVDDIHYQASEFQRDDINYEHTPIETDARIRSTLVSSMTSGIHSKASVPPLSPESTNPDNQERNYSSTLSQLMSRKRSSSSARNERPEVVAGRERPSTRASNTYFDSAGITPGETESRGHINVVSNIASGILPTSTASSGPHESTSRDEQDINYTSKTIKTVSKKDSLSSIESDKAENVAERSATSSGKSRGYTTSGDYTPEDIESRRGRNLGSDNVSGRPSSIVSVSSTREGAGRSMLPSASPSGEFVVDDAGVESVTESRQRSRKTSPGIVSSHLPDEIDRNLLLSRSPSTEFFVDDTHTQARVSHTNVEPIFKKPSVGVLGSRIRGGSGGSKLPSTRQSGEDIEDETPDQASKLHVEDAHDKVSVLHLEDLQGNALAEDIQTSRDDSPDESRPISVKTSANVSVSHVQENAGINLSASAKSLSPESRSQDEQEKNYTQESGQSMVRKSSFAKSEMSEGFAESKLPSTSASRDHAGSGTETPEETETRIQGNMESNFVSGVRSKASINSPSPKSPSRNEQEINYTGESKQSLSRKSSSPSAESKKSENIVDTRIPSTRASTDALMIQSVRGSTERFAENYQNEANIIYEDTRSKELITSRQISRSAASATGSIEKKDDQASRQMTTRATSISVAEYKRLHEDVQGSMLPSPAVSEKYSPQDVYDRTTDGEYQQRSDVQTSRQVSPRSITSAVSGQLRGDVQGSMLPSPAVSEKYSSQDVYDRTTDGEYQQKSDVQTSRQVSPRSITSAVSGQLRGDVQGSKLPSPAVSEKYSSQDVYDRTTDGEYQQRSDVQTSRQVSPRSITSAVSGQLRGDVQGSMLPSPAVSEKYSSQDVYDRRTDGEYQQKSDVQTSRQVSPRSITSAVSGQLRGDVQGSKLPSPAVSEKYSPQDVYDRTTDGEYQQRSDDQASRQMTTRATSISVAEYKRLHEDVQGSMLPSPAVSEKYSPQDVYDRTTDGEYQQRSDVQTSRQVSPRSITSAVSGQLRGDVQGSMLPSPAVSEKYSSQDVYDRTTDGEYQQKSDVQTSRQVSPRSITSAVSGQLRGDVQGSKLPSPAVSEKYSPQDVYDRTSDREYQQRSDDQASRQMTTRATSISVAEYKRLHEDVQGSMLSSPRVSEKYFPQDVHDRTSDREYQQRPDDEVSREVLMRAIPSDEYVADIIDDPLVGVTRFGKYKPSMAGPSRTPQKLIDDSSTAMSSSRTSSSESRSFWDSDLNRVSPGVRFSDEKQMKTIVSKTKKHAIPTSGMEFQATFENSLADIYNEVVVQKEKSAEDSEQRLSIKVIGVSSHADHSSALSMAISDNAFVVRVSSAPVNETEKDVPRSSRVAKSLETIQEKQSHEEIPGLLTGGVSTSRTNIAKEMNVPGDSEKLQGALYSESRRVDSGTDHVPPDSVTQPSKAIKYIDSATQHFNERMDSATQHITERMDSATQHITERLDSATQSECIDSVERYSQTFERIDSATQLERIDSAEQRIQTTEHTDSATQHSISVDNRITDTISPKEDFLVSKEIRSTKSSKTLLFPACPYNKYTSDTHTKGTSCFPSIPSTSRASPQLSKVDLGDKQTDSSKMQPGTTETQASEGLAEASDVSQEHKVEPSFFLRPDTGRDYKPKMNMYRRMYGASKQKSPNLFESETAFKPKSSSYRREQKFPTTQDAYTGEHSASSGSENVSVRKVILQETFTDGRKAVNVYIPENECWRAKDIIEVTVRESKQPQLVDMPSDKPEVTDKSQVSASHLQDQRQGKFATGEDNDAIEQLNKERMIDTGNTLGDQSVRMEPIVDSRHALRPLRHGSAPVKRVSRGSEEQRDPSTGEESANQAFLDQLTERSFNMLRLFLRVYGFVILLFEFQRIMSNGALD